MCQNTCDLNHCWHGSSRVLISRRRSALMPAILPEIRDFLALRRIALVGTSRDPKDSGRGLFREMCARGSDMVPVTPAADGQLEDKMCFARVQHIQPPVEGALVMT